MLWVERKVDLLILISDVIFALVAAILSVLGLKTLKAIRHLNIGKSFWTPIFVSGVLFLIGSVVAIFHEVDFSLTTNTEEVVHVSRLLALCILVVSIYIYSRKVKENLTKRVSIPERKVPESPETRVPIPESSETEVPIPERKIPESPKIETPPECKYQFGYLRTLPKDASIPDECLGCHKIVECTRG